MGRRLEGLQGADYPRQQAQSELEHQSLITGSACWTAPAFGGQIQVMKPTTAPSDP